MCVCWLPISFSFKASEDLYKTGSELKNSKLQNLAQLLCFNFVYISDYYTPEKQNTVDQESFVVKKIRTLDDVRK